MVKDDWHEVRNKFIEIDRKRGGDLDLYRVQCNDGVMLSEDEMQELKRAIEDLLNGREPEKSCQRCGKQTPASGPSICKKCRVDTSGGRHG